MIMGSAQLKSNPEETDSTMPIGRIKTRRDLHLARKIWHMSNGVLIAVGYLAVITDKPSFLVLLGVLMVGIVGLDFLRLRVKRLNEGFTRGFRILLRQEEVSKFNSSSYYIVGAFVSCLLFSKPIFIIAILCLAFGDPIAALVGQLYGKKKIFPNASEAGCLACFVTCFIVTATCVFFFGNITNHPFLFALAGGFAGLIAELLPTKIDDNFVIPFFCGLQLWVASQLLALW